MKTKLATDDNGNALQVSHPVTSGYQAITTAVLFSDDGVYYINPTGGEAWIKLEDSSPTAASGEGMYITTPITIKINAGQYLASSDEINVVLWSE